MKKDLIPKKIIDEYEVYCSHAECEWLGILGNLETHLKKCPFEKKKKLQVSEEFANRDCILVDDGAEEKKKKKEVINVEEIQNQNSQRALLFENDEAFMFSKIDFDEQNLFCVPNFQSFRVMRDYLGLREDIMDD